MIAPKPISPLPPPLTDEQRAKRAEDNRKATEEATRLAEDARLRDVRNGQKPVAIEVAESLKERLAREDFTPKE